MLRQGIPPRAGDHRFMLEKGTSCLSYVAQYCRSQASEFVREFAAAEDSPSFEEHNSSPCCPGASQSLQWLARIPQPKTALFGSLKADQSHIAAEGLPDAFEGGFFGRFRARAEEQYFPHAFWPTSRLPSNRESSRRNDRGRSGLDRRGLECDHTKAAVKGRSLRLKIAANAHIQADSLPCDCINGRCSLQYPERCHGRSRRRLRRSC
jgi:hypothetical protein